MGKKESTNKHSHSHAFLFFKHRHHMLWRRQLGFPIVAPTTRPISSRTMLHSRCKGVVWSCQDGDRLMRLGSCSLYTEQKLILTRGHFDLATCRSDYIRASIWFHHQTKLVWHVKICAPLTENSNTRLPFSQIIFIRLSFGQFYI
jgi:hypothetical protein